MHDKTKVNTNRKIIFGLLAAIFGLTAFLFLTVQSVGAVGYGWTGLGNFSDDCSGNLSRIKIETRERVLGASVDAGSISAEIRELSDDSLVDTVTGSERETATSGCVFDPSLHYVRVTVTGNSLYHSVFTEFKTGDPNFFKNKSINFFAWVHEIAADPVVEHSEPAYGVWLNYKPDIKIVANDVFILPVSGGPIQIERVTLEMQGPTYVTEIFDKDSTPPGPWSPGIINLGSQSTITPGWYQWGVFLNDREGTNANVSGWSGIRSFGYDIAPPIVSCSIAYNPGTGNIDVVLNETDALSGVGAGLVNVSINGGGWSTFGLPNGGDTMDDFSYTPPFGTTFGFQYRVRDNTVDSSGNPTQWTAFEPCGSVTPGAPIDPDLIITSSKDSVVPTNTIISAMNPPSYNGGRSFDSTQSLPLEVG